MLSKLGENYPYKRDRSAPGLIRQQKNESRNYNIITCIDKPASQVSSTRFADSLPQIDIPKQRKLGEYKDFPYPRNKKDCETNINFNKGNKKLEMGNESVQSQQNTIRQASQLYQNKNLMNCSSVGYNFITNTIVENPKTIQELRGDHQNICNRTKQIGSIYDKGRLFAPNFNPEYQSFFKTNEIAFHRNKGMCADTYNRAHTYGPGLKPFRKFK
ncbi:hypothetical protein ABPG74_002226 [Tetrahymena malaccensis]